MMTMNNIAPAAPYDATDPVDVKAAIVAQLRQVHDPEIPVNIYDLGLIYRIELFPTETAFRAEIDMTLTSPNCPVAGQMPGMVEAAARHVAGLESVAVQLVFDPPWSRDVMSDAAKLELNLF